MVRNLGFEVDNDNEHAPKNVPAADAPVAVDEGLYEGQHLGWDGIDCRATMQGSMYNDPKFAHDWTPQNKTFAEVFLWFFLPTTFLKSTILADMNDALRVENSAPASYIGLWLLMACYMGHSPEDYWAPKVSTGNKSES